MSMTDVAFAAGFASVRQFNDTVREVFATSPTQLRAHRRRRDARDGRAAAIARRPVAGLDHVASSGSCSVRSPQSVFAFLGARVVPGVETWDGTVYRRSLRLPDGAGVVALQPARRCRVVHAVARPARPTCRQPCSAAVACWTWTPIRWRSTGSSVTTRCSLRSSAGAPGAALAGLCRRCRTAGAGDHRSTGVGRGAAHRGRSPGRVGRRQRGTLPDGADGSRAPVVPVGCGVGRTRPRSCCPCHEPAAGRWSARARRSPTGRIDIDLGADRDDLASPAAAAARHRAVDRAVRRRCAPSAIPTCSCRPTSASATRSIGWVSRFVRRRPLLRWRSGSARGARTPCTTCGTRLSEAPVAAPLRTDRAHEEDPMLSITTMPSPVGRADDRRQRRRLFASSCGTTTVSIASSTRSAGAGPADAARIAATALLADAVAPARGVLRGHSHRVRPAARSAGHTVPAVGVDAAAHHPVRSDGQLRVPGPLVGRRRTSRVPSARRTARTRSASSCRAIAWSDPNGSLTGFAGGIESKAWLLDHERRVLVGAERVSGGQRQRPRHAGRGQTRLRGLPPDAAARASACLRSLAALRRALVSSSASRASTTGATGSTSRAGSASTSSCFSRRVSSHRCGGLAGDRRGQRQANRRQPVALDQPGRHLGQVVLGRVVGRVAQLLDAVGQARIGQHGGDLLERTGHAPTGDGGTDRDGAGRWIFEARLVASTAELVDRLAVVVGQRGHECLEFVVGHGEQSTIEQRQRLEAVLHLIHGLRGYRPGPTMRSVRPVWRGGTNGPDAGQGAAVP